MPGSAVIPAAQQARRSAPVDTTNGAQKTLFISQKTIDYIKRELPHVWPRVHQSIIDGRYIAITEAPAL